MILNNFFEMLNLTDKTLQLRPILKKDMSFLKKVYSSTRTEEMNQVSFWTDEMKDAFLTHQFDAQHEHYQKNYLSAQFWVLEKKGIEIGRLYYDELFKGSIRIVDITLLPEFRNKGLGQIILKSILDRAKTIEKNVTIHVESFNPAMNLYHKLGFKKISETTGVYHLLEWNYKN